MRRQQRLWCVLAALLGVVASAARGAADYAPDRWLAKTLPEIAQDLQGGHVTAEQLVRSYLQRIAQIDAAGPRLQAVLSINPDALDQARQSDRLRSLGKSLGLLHGVPILLKDNIESRDNLPTTAGSLAMLENFARRDAHLVAGLRAQGAIILGKTNLSEWANFRSESSVWGWSGVGGQVRNPHALDRTPCGSSSGSGVAIAASLAAAAVGTETNGSIICPAALNGIVGFKPTVGLVAQTGIVPISPLQDTAGPMTKSVRGSAMMLAAMDDRDVDYAAHLRSDALRGRRVGVARFAQGDDPNVQLLFDAALQALSSQGAQLIDVDTAPVMPENFQALSYRGMLSEFKPAINAYLASTPASVRTRTLADLIAFNGATPRELILFDQSIFEQAQAVTSADGELANLRAALRNATAENGIDLLLSNHNVDLLVAPSFYAAPSRNVIQGDRLPRPIGLGWLAAIAGYPHATVPMGHVQRLPVGISFIGTVNTDGEILGYAYAYEQASHRRVEPAYLHSIEDDPRFARALSPAHNQLP